LQDGDEDADGCSTTAESTASVHERHCLEDKLKELRDKKRGIDELLNDLMSLKVSQRLLNNGTLSFSCNLLIVC